MGSSSSKIVEGGSLVGAYAPPVVEPLPPTPTKERVFRINHPIGKKPGQRIQVSINGSMRSVTIPPKSRPGQSFEYRLSGQIEKVLASTLPTIAGMEIVCSKPILYATVAYAYVANGNDQQMSMAKQVGSLIQEAQAKILNEAIKVGCNAVLGMSFNITNDSSDSDKLVIVTAVGTPSCVVPTGAAAPVLVTNVMVEPLYNA